MNKLFRLFCVFGFLALAGQALAAKIQTYVFDIQKDSLHQQITMTVEFWSNTQVVNYSNEFGEHEMTVFRKRFQPLQVTYINQTGQVYGKVLYDYKRSSVKISGLNNVKYHLAENTYDNNGSLFYLFSLFYPATREPLTFHLLQSNLAHIENPWLRLLVCQLVGPVEMYLQDLGPENVVILGSCYRANKYELGIHDPRLAPFWPNKYYFWFQAGDRKPLKYEGLDADQRINTIVLVDYYERDLPETPEPDPPK